MSFTPLSPNEWLESLPAELQSDIASSAAVLTPPLLALRQSIDDSPEDLHLLDDPTTAVTRHFSPLLRLMTAIEECPLSLKWSSSLTRSDDDSIVKEVNSLRFWLIAGRKKSSASPKAISCWHIVLSAKQYTTPSSLWHILFADLHPQATPPAVANPIQSTPLCVSSGNRMDMATTHSIVDLALQHELDKLVYINTDRFLETYFPPQPNAFDQCREFLREENETRHGWPDDATEESVIDWFCEVTTAMLHKVTPRIDRHYYRSADCAITGAPAVRKKYILLYPTTTGRRFPSGNIGANWTFDVSEVLVVGVLNKCIDQDATTRDLVMQLAGYVRLMFYHQQNRRFVHAFTLAGDYMRCYIFHRGGAFASEIFSINAEPRRFIDVVIGYATMTPAELGYDTTLVFDQYKFQMDGCAGLYKIKKAAIIIRPVIASRGTTCWDVTRKGDKGRVKKEYVLKDTWRNVLYESEADFYNHAIATNVKGLAQVLAMEEVTFQGERDEICQNIMKGLIVSGKPLDLAPVPAEKDIHEPLLFGYRKPAIVPSAITDATIADTATTTTKETVPRTPPTTRSLRNSTIARKPSNKHKIDFADPPPSAKRSRSAPPPVFNRVHTRILMHKGRQIALFTSPRELLLGLHDAIVGHRSLLQDAGILHRDISLYNIMLTSTTNPRADGMHGFLIDLDMAVKTAAPRPSGALHRTGTVEFMAIGVLRGDPHTYRHDLESFWYVFIWLCVYKDSRLPLHYTPLSRWGAPDFITIARNKRANIVRGEADGYQTIEDAFLPECKCFLTVADEWRRVLFPLLGTGEATLKLDAWVDVDAAYESVLGVLKKAAEAFGC